MSNQTPPLTTAEVAERFEVTAKTVTRWATNGTLPHLTKLPGLRGPYLFDPKAVEKFAKARSAA